MLQRIITNILLVMSLGGLMMSPALAADGTKTAADWVDKGQAAMENEKYDTAISDFTQALKLDPKNFEAYSERGMAYGYTLDFDAGIADMTTAIKYSPEDYTGGYYILRGILYQLDKKTNEAIADYKKALTYQLAEEDQKLCQKKLRDLGADTSAEQNKQITP